MNATVQLVVRDVSLGGGANAEFTTTGNDAVHIQVFRREIEKNEDLLKAGYGLRYVDGHLRIGELYIGFEDLANLIAILQLYVAEP